MFAYGFLQRAAEDRKEKTIKVVEERLKVLVRYALDNVEVDENWYLDTNLDVKAAIKDGLIDSARGHYIKSGYFEDRWPRPIRVDEVWYLKTYPDIAKAIRGNKFESAQEHFELHGFREGRLPYPGWSLFTDAGDAQAPNLIAE